MTHRLPPRRIARALAFVLGVLLTLAWGRGAHASPFELPPASGDSSERWPGDEAVSMGVVGSRHGTLAPALPDAVERVPDPTERTKGTAPAATQAVANAANVRRIGLIVGANDGGPERETLRYASADATLIARVLRELGGIEGADLVRLADPDPAELRAAFDRIRRRVRSSPPGARVQFLFYYSGHSDESGLLLGGSRLDYRSLRREIDEVPADVHIAILDSCASGAFTRLKGGTKRAPFLVNTANDVEGHAFLTSSSADEAAQESDRIGGSFFTHYLGTGLRGAADANGDGLITLSEAYEFAFDETLARTEATRAGAQHAAYDIQLSGTGDLVMTDLRRTTARLELTPEIGGRIYVRKVKGDLAAELYKPTGSAPVLLALEPGRYVITVDDDRRLWRADVEVADGRRTTLTPADLSVVEREKTTRRGGEDEPYRDVPFNVGLFPPLSLNGAAHHPRVRNQFSAAVVWSRAARVDGAAIALGLTIIDEELHGMTWSFVGNIARGNVRGGQLATGFNAAVNVRGVQLGAINRATTIEQGAQGGVINTAGRVHGMQFGLVNYAQSADGQFGLVSVTKEGGVHGELWTSDTALVNVGLRLPSKYTYSLFVAGLSPVPTAGRALMLGWGFGGRVPLPHRLGLELDTTGWVVSNGLRIAGPPGLLAKLRLILSWQPRRHFGVFGGLTLNAMFDGLDGSGRETPRPGYGWTSYTWEDRGTTTTPTDPADGAPLTGTRIRVWPGFAAGVRF